jgi:ankyrin repeat protein
MASLLLQNGANPNAEDCRGVKPLHEAARKNHAAIVKMLLEAGVDPLTPKTSENHSGRLAGGEKTTKGETAVQYVCQQGHTESVQVMLQFVQPETLEELLCESCRYGKFEAAKVVLERSNVSPNSKFRGATALYLAARARSVHCVEALLARGADVHLVSLWEPRRTMACMSRGKPKASTPLHALVSDRWDGNHVACQRILRLLMGAGANLESKDGDGDTPLLGHFGRHRVPSLEIVESLLEAGANVSAINRCGDSVLHRFLVDTRDLEILELLLRHGADVNVRGRLGYTALHWALSSPGSRNGPNNVNEVVEFLLNKGASCNVKDNLGCTPLETAVRSSDCSFETIKLLLQACPDPDAHRKCLFTLSRRGNQERKVELIQELMTIGVSLEARDSLGRTALLANTTSEDYFQALLNCGARLDAVDTTGRGVLHHYIFSSSSYPTVKRLRSLIEIGLDPRKVDNDGNTILHEVVKLYRGTKKEIEFIELLLDFGISVNAKNLLGRTPLHIQLEFGRVMSSHNEQDIMPLLCLFQKSKECLSLDAQDVDGLTLLHLAALRSEIDVARLLAAGADASLLTNDGRSALHLACRARKSNIVGYLLHETGNLLINKADSFERTPLHDACTSGRPESVYYLLKFGASVSAKDSNGRTPLHSCAEFSTEQHIWSLLQHRNETAGQFSHDRYRPDATRPHRDGPWYSSNYSLSPPGTIHDTARVGGIVKSLLAAGASVTATDSTKNTPLDLALAYGCQEMIRTLRSTATEVQKSWEVGPTDPRFQTEIALRQRAGISALNLPTESLQDVLRKPVQYLSLLDHKDVDWIAKHGGDITGAESDFPEASLLHVAAGGGLTEIMESLGNLARFFDNPDSVRALLKPKNTRYYAESVAPTLHVACKRELPNIEMLELLVDTCGVDVNGRALIPQSQWAQLIQGIEGPTALHVLATAKSWWQLDAIQLLVKRGANVTSRNEKGETPLHIASVGDNLTIMGDSNGFWRPACVQLLLDLGADPNALDNNGLSCLHKASSAPDTMKTLLQHGADLSAGKVSPLFAAINAQDLEALTIILGVGASPNSKATPESCQVHYTVKGQERWALFCASFPHLFNQDIKSSAPLVELLIARGADLYAPLNDRETLIHYVFEHAEYPIVCAFLECADKIDFNAKDQLGRTVFLAACNWGECLPGYRHKHWYPKVTGPFIRLLDLGADPLFIDPRGRNALHHLLDNPDVEVDCIHEFLKHDAAKTLLNAKDGKGFTPLNYALRILRPTIVEALIAMGANLLEPDPTGATALHQIAAQCLRVYLHKRKALSYQKHEPNYYEGCLRLWQKFQDLGGDINVRDNTGSPPLFFYLLSPPRDDYSARNNPKNEDCCHVDNFMKYFRNADVNARNEAGETALHVIARREKTYHATEIHERKLFEFFAGKALDPLAEDGRDRSALDVAAACGKKGILELFQRE